MLNDHMRKILKEISACIVASDAWDPIIKPILEEFYAKAKAEAAEGNADAGECAGTVAQTDGGNNR